MQLYHYTDTVRLPWILASGELRPSKNRIGGMPADLVWATDSSQGDLTASAHRGDSWRSGDTWHVRFVLEEIEFQRWTDVRESLPDWTPTQVARLEGFKGANPAAWWCRGDPLPLGPQTVIEARSYANNRWRSVTVEQIKSGRDTARVCSIDGRMFGSIRNEGIGPGRTDGYTMLSIQPLT